MCFGNVSHIEEGKYPQQTDHKGSYKLVEVALNNQFKCICLFCLVLFVCISLTTTKAQRKVFD